MEYKSMNIKNTNESMYETEVDSQTEKTNL